MAAANPPKDHLSDLERHIRILEEKIAKLRASLAHWQKWYLEYSALQEEVSSLPPDPEPRKELARIRRDFDSEILSKKEINEIFGKHDLKARDQVLSVLTRRVDYVEQNLGSLQKVLETEENKLAAANVVAYPDAGVDEETGLPITDIVERLDDDDNVIDFKLQSGGDLEPRILEALKKVGVDDLASASKPSSSDEQTATRAAGPSTAGPRGPQTEKAAPSRRPPKEVLVPDESDEEKTAPPRKSVSFVEDTKPGHEPEEEPQPSRAAQELAQIMQMAKEQEAMDLSTAVIPDDEAAEDGELRRQMLQYGMSEIGPVVAELELEEGDDDDDDDSLYDDDNESDSEDELGRSKTSVITEDYIQRMKELEKRLGVQSAFTAAPHQPNQPQTPLPEEGIGRISVQREAESKVDDSVAQNGKGKKSVKFASSVPDNQTNTPEEPKINPLGDVLERTGGAPSSRDDAGAEASKKRPSRFKKERGASSEASPAPGGLPQGPHQVPARFSQAVEAEPLPPMPTGPEGQTIADTVVEREVSSTPRDPDEFDNQLLHQAASVEYNRMRNRMIQRQGGFTKESEPAITPVEEEEDEPPVRVSRFKAARLSRQP